MNKVEVLTVIVFLIFVAMLLYRKPERLGANHFGTGLIGYEKDVLRR